VEQFRTTQLLGDSGLEDADDGIGLWGCCDNADVIDVEGVGDVPCFGSVFQGGVSIDEEEDWRYRRPLR
jgi:hypothetical protein